MNEDSENQEVLRLKSNLKVAALICNEARRTANTSLYKYTQGEEELYNPEDLKRLVGQLECLHDHLVTSILSDYDTYCALKHLSAAQELLTELTDWEHWEIVGKQLWGIMGYISNNTIRPCSSCKEDRKE